MAIHHAIYSFAKATDIKLRMKYGNNLNKYDILQVEAQFHIIDHCHDCGMTRFPSD